MIQLPRTEQFNSNGNRSSLVLGQTGLDGQSSLALAQTGLDAAKKERNSQFYDYFFSAPYSIYP